MLMMNIRVMKQFTSATFFPSSTLPKVTTWTKSSYSSMRARRPN